MAQAVNQSPGGCGCGCIVTSITGTFFGCNSLGIPSMTVEAHDATAGGTLLGTTTTNSSGVYTFTSLGAVSGNNIVLVPVTGGRFTATNRTLTWTSGTPSNSQWGCAKTTPNSNITLAAAAGYQCIGCCPTPLPTTMHVSDSQPGVTALALTYSGVTADWEGSISYSFPGCFGCPPKTVTIQYRLIGIGATCVLNIQYRQGPPCPDPAGPLSGWVSGSSLTVSSCLPFNGSGTRPGSGTGDIYCGAATTYTVTE
jgi:hypothetical protein